MMKNWWRTAQLLISIGAIIMSSACSATGAEPVFYLQYSIENAEVDVRLNDIPVLRSDAEGSTVSEKPVPEFIVDGRNVIAVSVRQLEEEEGRDFLSGRSSAEVKLVAREKGSPLNQYEIVMHLKVHAVSNEREILVGSDPKAGDKEPVVKVFTDGQIIAEREVSVESPYPRWAWQDGADLEKTEENFEELFAEYRKIYNALKGEKMEDVKKIYAPAAKEYAAAYHYDDPEEGHRIMNTGGFIGDSDWRLGDIQVLVDNNIPLQMEIYANGKLARIVDDYGDQIINLYLNDSADLVAWQKYGFYKARGGEWVMIR